MYHMCLMLCMMPFSHIDSPLLIKHAMRLWELDNQNARGCGVQEIGADETLDYRSQDFAEVYQDKPFDYIFDSVGGTPA